MIETLISSKTRIKLLLKFFLNSNTTAYLRVLESEFGESSNSIRLELNKFEGAGMLTSFLKGNRKYFTANTEHPLFNEVHSIVMKYVGLDRIVENVIEKLGNVERVYLVGDFSNGQNSQIIDLIFVGDIDKVYLLKLVDKAEQFINRKVRYLIYSQSEASTIDWSTYQTKPLLLWSRDITATP